MKKSKLISIMGCIVLPIVLLHGQGKLVETNNQYWVGLMTSATISTNYALWNDFHLVPEGFGVVRTGLTRNFDKASLTVGYAHLWLPVGSSNVKLQRHEQRPWGQLQFNLPLNKKNYLIQRIRYDARFREEVAHGEVQEGYTFSHRVRFLLTLKHVIGSNTERKLIPYLGISNEVLLNFGKETTNTFDQNRISVAVGVQQKNTQYQLGFMNRFVQTGVNKYTLNHTLVFWVTQKFDLRPVLGRRNTEAEKMLK